MAVAMLPVPWRSTPTYVDLPKEGQYPKPTPLKPSAVVPRICFSFWSSGHSFWPSGPSFWPSGPSFWPSGPLFWSSGPAFWPSGLSFWPFGPLFWFSGRSFWPSGPSFWPLGLHFLPFRPLFWASGPSFWPSGPSFRPSGPSFWPSGLSFWSSGLSFWPLGLHFGLLGLYFGLLGLHFGLLGLYFGLLGFHFGLLGLHLGLGSLGLHFGLVGLHFGLLCFHFGLLAFWAFILGFWAFLSGAWPFLLVARFYHCGPLLVRSLTRCQICVVNSRTIQSHPTVALYKTALPTSGRCCARTRPGRSAPSALCRRMLPGCPNPRPPSCTGRGWLVGPPPTEDEAHVAPGNETKANESMRMQQTTTAVRRTASLRLSFLSVVSVTPQFAPACCADPRPGNCCEWTRSTDSFCFLLILCNTWFHFFLRAEARWGLDCPSLTCAAWLFCAGEDF